MAESIICRDPLPWSVAGKSYLAHREGRTRSLQITTHLYIGDKSLTLYPIELGGR